MHTKVLLATLVLLWGLQQPYPGSRKKSKPVKQQPSTTQQSAAPDQRGTEQPPLAVKILPPTKTQQEAEEERKEREEKAANDRHLVWFSGILALIAFFQLLVYAYQAKKLRETVEAAGEQSKAMERHIGEAARSANAMEQIAGVIQSGNEAIMRAYLSVVIGTAVYQDRAEGVKFQGKPSLVNTGSTPARNVRVRIAAEIVPTRDAETFAYPLPEVSGINAPAIAAPHQNYMLTGVVEQFVPDVDVADIKQGIGSALTVWGVVTYDDIFGRHHTTRFAQWLLWFPNGTIYGNYIPGQNDMD